MPSKKSNVIVMLVLLIITLRVITYVFPVPEEPLRIVKWAYFIPAMGLSYGMYYYYIKIRNIYFNNKLTEYYSQKKYEEAISLLDKAIKNQPQIAWMRMHRAVLFGLSGKFDNFWTEFSLIYNKEPFCKNNEINYYPILAISDALDFINNTSTKMRLSETGYVEMVEEYLESSYLYIHKAIFAYQNNDMQSVVRYCELLCDEESNFRKLFSTFILMKVYENLGQMDKSDNYRKLYMSNPLNYK